MPFLLRCIISRQIKLPFSIIPGSNVEKLHWTFRLISIDPHGHGAEKRRRKGIWKRWICLMIWISMWNMNIMLGAKVLHTLRTKCRRWKNEIYTEGLRSWCSGNKWLYFFSSCDTFFLSCYFLWSEMKALLLTSPLRRNRECNNQNPLYFFQPALCWDPSITTNATPNKLYFSLLFPIIWLYPTSYNLVLWTITCI